MESMECTVPFMRCQVEYHCIMTDDQSLYNQMAVSLQFWLFSQ